MFLPSVVRASFKLLVKHLKMVAIKFIVLLIAALCESKKSLMPQAILQLVKSNYGERPVVIEVLYTSKKVTILDETLKLLSNIKQVKVTPINIIEYFSMEGLEIANCIRDPEIVCSQNYSNDAIFLFDSWDNYQVWKGRYLTTHIALGRSKLNHYVHFEEASQEKIEATPKSNTYERFLLEQNGQISLHVMTMYTEKQCRQEQLVEINQFSSLERKWKTDKFFRPRIENFHGCKLWIDFYPTFLVSEMPFLRMQKDENDAMIVEGGVFFDMLDALSTHLNFTYIHGPTAPEELGVFNQRNDIDLVITTNMLDIFGEKSSYPIYSTADVAVVPPGELFTSWEKLLMPFDRLTWMWLIITFVIAFLVILLIMLSKSTSVREFVIGSNVSTPTLNVIAIFMGIGQILLPQRNVSRFFFMVFILFSLIMRTAYQGKYFEFLTSDMRRKPIQTIEELKDRNFTAIVDYHHCLYIYCKTDLFTG